MEDLKVLTKHNKGDDDDEEDEHENCLQVFLCIGQLYIRPV